MKYGYARISTIDQKADLQLTALRSAGVKSKKHFQRRAIQRHDEAPFG